MDYKKLYAKNIENCLGNNFCTFINRYFWIQYKYPSIKFEYLRKWNRKVLGDNSPKLILRKKYFIYFFL